MARALVAAIVAALLAVPGAGGSPGQTPKRGGTLVLGGYREPICLGLQPECTPQPLQGLVLAGAWSLKGDRWAPALVARISRTKDPLTLVYHIRPEARWSDGTPVTSADFVFTHRVWVREGLAQLGETVWANVQPLGRKSLRVRLAKRSADWRVFPLFVLPRHVFAGRDPKTLWRDTIDNPKTGDPIGTGPFLLQRYERGKQITLVRNPRYSGSHTAYLDRLITRIVQGTAAVDALLRGEIDFAPGPLLEQDLPRLRDAPGIELRAYPGTGRTHLAIRVGPGGHPALRNKLVRRALAYGIDREAIVRDLFADVAPRLRPLDNLLFLRQQPGYQPNWSRYRYQPRTARRLLEQAGCRRDVDGIYECAGERLRLRFVTTAGVEHRRRTLELVQGQLIEVGVEVVADYAPSDPFFDQILPSGKWDVALFAWSSDWPEDVPASAYRCQGELNYTGYCNRLATRDLAQLDAIIDPEQFIRVGNAADTKLARDVPAIPLFQRPFVDAMKSTVRAPAASGYPFFLNLEDWWLDERR